MFTVEHFKQLNYAYLADKINAISLKNSSEYITNDLYRSYYLKNAGSEHYKLLAFFSTLFNDCQLFDIGTHIGGSSIAMSYNPKNIVVSYDIVNCRELRNPPKNIMYEVGDFRLDSDVLNSPFIFIDADHNGKDEWEFHNFFLSKRYKGVILWDDIHLNPDMRYFWSLVKNEKYDLTGLGHETGTGMIFYA